MKKYLHVFISSLLLFVCAQASAADVNARVLPSQTPYISCEGPMSFVVLVENIGTENNLNGYILNIYVDEELKKTYESDTVLGAFSRDYKDISLDELNQGTHQIRVELLTKNDDVDTNMSNNVFQFKSKVVGEGIPTLIEASTDFYVGDIFNFYIYDTVSLDTVFRIDNIYRNAQNPGRYEMIQDICLPEGCYKFFIGDEFADGWSSNDESFLHVKQKSDNKYALKKEMNYSFAVFQDKFCLPAECSQEELTAEYEHATAPGVSDAAIVVYFDKADKETEYSIDGGTNYQKSNIFFQLAEGTYTVTVRDAYGCIYEITVNITADVDQLLAKSVKIYPNPVSNSLHISYGDLNTNYIKQVQVLNAMGATIDRIENVQATGNKLDVSAYASGMYMILVESEKGIFVKRFVRL